ncbi:TylF/MycF/NovP-related O-methyltransferase [Polynucleobacter sp. es-EL-1]|uniref:TylF/MycF/NovP-related O-methyltransferase n=1 Tax=Polynucleobacter sp. es-EL-1 TaxID=1855652 RepID=UPI001BFD59DE|nr:TylF/MycF/NovP-related O-methyltransferase [Polynucleobacter sp. es-EL-1]QWE10875.1 class I SAM-dependent methyltransferase [Polynucleobacter sp. es-EL-1]
MKEIGNESIGVSTTRDVGILEKRAEILSSKSLAFEDVLVNFPVFTRRIHITRFLAHYELYKMIQNIPGSIVELGVFKGASLFAFAHFLEIFNHGDRSRKVIGFDSFEGLQNFTEEDGAINPEHGKVAGGWGAGVGFEGELLSMMDLFSQESFVPQAKRMELVKGDILETVPRYVAENPGLRISLLHFDCDLYEPTLIGLKNLVPLMLPGGLIVFDEFAITAWAGETKAVEEYFGQGKRIEKFSWTTSPGGFIRF